MCRPQFKRRVLTSSRSGDYEETKKEKEKEKKRDVDDPLNRDDFWTHLFDNHGLTREDLASMKAGWRTDGIMGPGMHLPQLINPMKHFYWILRTTHGGGNMNSAMDFARGNMPEDIQNEILDVLGNRDEWWVPNKIVELRERLVDTWKFSGRGRR